MTGKELEFLLKSTRLSVTDISKLMGLSRATLYDWFKKNLIDPADELFVKNAIQQKLLNPLDEKLNESINLALKCVSWSFTIKLKRKKTPLRCLIVWCKINLKI